MKKNLFILFLIFLIPIKALAVIEVDITRGNLNPLPLAVSPLSIDDQSKKSFEKILNKQNIGSEISIIVENNLRTSGLFNPLNKNASLLNGLNKPDVLKLFSTIVEISEPIFSFLRIFSKLFLDLSSIDKGEIANGRGFKFPLVISTSIKAKALIGIKVIKNKIIIFFFICLS